MSARGQAPSEQPLQGGPCRARPGPLPLPTSPAPAGHIDLRTAGGAWTKSRTQIASDLSRLGPLAQAPPAPRKWPLPCGVSLDRELLSPVDNKL